MSAQFPMSGEPVQRGNALHKFENQGEIEQRLSKTVEKLQKERFILRSALEKIIDMNRQHALDQSGDAEKAEAWSCVAVARKALIPIQ